MGRKAFIKMKKVRSVIGILLSITILGACGAPPINAVESDVPDKNIPDKNIPDETETPVAEDTVLPEEIPGIDSEEKERLAAFGKVLWDAYQKGIVPGGHALDYYYGIEGAAENSFALADVDGDGQDELLLFWKNACMAGKEGYIFGYRNGEVLTELWEFPSMTFYDSGIVKVEWSHNQGLAGDFWPYSAYCYDAEEDVYRLVGSVDAWDEKVSEEDNYGRAFPVEIDADGDGLVYYIFLEEHVSYQDAPLVDGAEYEKWWNGYVDGAEEIDITIQKLTEENIAALGYPKPDVPIPQPAG